jgi:hypothetical protein
MARRHGLLAATLALFAIMAPPNEYSPVFETLGTQALVWGILLSAFAYARALITVRRP